MIKESDGPHVQKQLFDKLFQECQKMRKTQSEWGKEDGIDYIHFNGGLWRITDDDCDVYQKVWDRIRDRHTRDIYHNFMW